MKFFKPASKEFNNPSWIRFGNHNHNHIFLLKQVIYGCNTADVDLLSTTNIPFFVEKKYNFYNL